MQFGVCTGPELARLARDIGYDYFEWSVGELLHPRESEEAFEAALAEARQVGIPFPTANMFLPADLKVTGPAVDRPVLETFVRTALRRAEKAGVQIIGFGAGEARRIPDGFHPQQAWSQMVDFCRWMAPIAAQHGVTIAIEPLNKSETNLINTAEEAVHLAQDADHPNIRMVIDGYHWAKDQNTASGILDNPLWIAHAHVATAEGRRPPNPRDTCAPFFALLKQAGYQGRVSFEGNLQNPEEELRQALEIMRSLTEDSI